MDFHFIVLAILFALSNVFWGYLCLKLINKLMSRNFYEYKVAESIGKEKKSNSKIKQQEPGIYDSQTEADLRALEGFVPGF